MNVEARLWLIFLVGIAASCDDEPGEPARSVPSAPSGTEPALEREADLEPPPASAWPSDVVGLSDSLSEVTDVESCRARLRERMPVEVAEVMADLSYAQVIDDVCAGLVAVRDRSVEGCDALSVSALQRGCRRRLALVAGDPALCPEALAATGREPVCVAWAARDPGLCRAAGPADEPRCRAVLAGDAAGCRRYRGGDRARCEAEVRRYQEALGDERRESAASEMTPSFRFTAEVEREGSHVEPVVIEQSFLDRGVYLAARGCAHHLVLEDSASALPTPVSFTDRPATAELELDVPVGAEVPREIPIGPAVAELHVLLPGIGEASSIVGAEGKVTITEWSADRGGAIAGDVDARLTLTPGRVHVRGSFRSFVRDVDTPACAGAGE